MAVHAHPLCPSPGLTGPGIGTWGIFDHSIPLRGVEGRGQPLIAMLAATGPAGRSKSDHLAGLHTDSGLYVFLSLYQGARVPNCTGYTNV